MRNIKLTIEYDGSRYQGWQRLGKGESTNTIANKLSEVLKKMTNEDTEIFCGARTEVGVHAYGQVINFKTTSDLKIHEIQHYLNRYLPMDIAVIEAVEVPERFHASLNAKSKTYLYRIAIGEVPSVFDRKFTYYSFKAPDVEAMKQAALLLVGRHDFKNFSTVKKSKSTEKEITDINICQDGEEIQIRLTGNDFLHNMPRIILSTLLDIGTDKRKKEAIENIFSGKEEASVPCDAKGLYLQNIEY
ncbi:MAG: tRNA pseudouridine(38-40) synthase TruA [Hespellia sp.]|nr:tRNA pseudouridine(38-40) synthase TruA [Hespellia sp.]